MVDLFDDGADKGVQDAYGHGRDTDVMGEGTCIRPQPLNKPEPPHQASTYIYTQPRLQQLDPASTASLCFHSQPQSLYPVQ